MKRSLSICLSLFAVAVLSAALAAQTSSVGRYDSAIATRATQQLAAKQEFHDVRATVDALKVVGAWLQAETGCDG